MDFFTMDARLGKWRRRAIVGAIAVVAAITIVIELFTAAKLALEPLVGRAGAHLVVAGLIALGVSALIGWVAYAEKRERAKKEAAPDEARMSVIAEAMSLGFALGRGVRRARKPRAKTDEATSETKEPAGAAG